MCYLSTGCSVLSPPFNNATQAYLSSFVRAEYRSNQVNKIIIISVYILAQIILKQMLNFFFKYFRYVRAHIELKNI